MTLTGFERHIKMRIRPPELQRREVVFRGGSRMSSMVGANMQKVSDQWQAVHLPFIVVMGVPNGPNNVREKMRTWMNKNLKGMWCFAMPPDEVQGPTYAVRFSDQTEASAFRIFWG